jgi:hypothetical protein
MRAVQRIIAILESFAPEKSSLTLQELADHIGLAKSTTFRIVQSLQRAGYLVRLQDQKYCLSFRLTRLAGLVNSTLSIREIRPPYNDSTGRRHQGNRLDTNGERSKSCLHRRHCYLDVAVTQCNPAGGTHYPGSRSELKNTCSLSAKKDSSPHRCANGARRPMRSGCRDGRAFENS